MAGIATQARYVAIATALTCSIYAAYSMVSKIIFPTTGVADMCSAHRMRLQLQISPKACGEVTLDTQGGHVL